MTPEQIAKLQKCRQYIKENYTPKHSHLYNFTTQIFNNAFIETVTSQDSQKLKSLLHQEAPEIYSFDMLKSEFCEQLLEEAKFFEDWCKKEELDHQVPNTMNNYGVVLDDFGFYPFLQTMMQKCVCPISSMLYADAGGNTLDAHHGFIVEYAIGKDTQLDFHVDASDVTLNICLGREFSGGALYFGGIRCGQCQQTAPRPEENLMIDHSPGRALLHRGKHRHSATEIKSGERFNLILWCISAQYQNNFNHSECPQWCGNK